MIASLRGRLVAGVLAVAAAGMLLVGGITYATQRSFQLSRLDSQLAAATQPLLNKLDGDDDRYGAHDERSPHGPPAGGGAPTDTYGEIRDSGGNVVRSGFLGPQDDSTARPSLPSHPETGRAYSVNGSRVLATSLAGGATAVVAV